MRGICESKHTRLITRLARVEEPIEWLNKSARITKRLRLVPMNLAINQGHLQAEKMHRYTGRVVYLSGIGVRIAEDKIIKQILYGIASAGDWCLMIMKTLRQCSHFQEGVCKGRERRKKQRVG